jgi:hypothetical protein
MHQPSPYLITICQQLEHQIGFKIINIAKAQKCSDLLAAEKLHISMHTIARIYGVVKPFRTPYKDTLNIFARYLKYIDWEDFCANQTNIPFDPNYFLTETSDGFSLAVLQLALVNEDFEGLKKILDKASDNNKSILFTAAELIGAYVRKSKRQKELLQLLANKPIGHLFFFECYVDEDNELNYFSEALLQLYLPKVVSDYKKLFVYAFEISQVAYKKNSLSKNSQQFQDLVKQLDKNKCHFHELSRSFECSILIDGYNGILENTWKNHLNEILKWSASLPDDQSVWLFSRAIKALVYWGYKEELYHYEKLNTAVDGFINNQKKEIHSIALYVIQLYWISKSMYFKSKIIYTPFRIHNILFQNESNEKKAIEFGIAALFATGVNKSIMTSNLNIYCKEKGTSWVVKLLD